MEEGTKPTKMYACGKIVKKKPSVRSTWRTSVLAKSYHLRSREPKLSQNHAKSAQACRFCPPLFDIYTEARKV